MVEYRKDQVESLGMTFQLAFFGTANKKCHPSDVESIIKEDKFRDSSASNSLFEHPFQCCPSLSPAVILAKTSKR